VIVHHRNSYSALPGRGLAFYRGFIMEKLSTTDKPGKTFIWLPFTGGLSAFAVILASPMGSLRGKYREDSETDQLASRHVMEAGGTYEIAEASAAARADLHSKDQGRTTISLLKILDRFGAGYRLCRERYRQRQQLLEMNDRQLKDIGITREQAEQEGGKPLWKG